MQPPEIAFLVLWVLVAMIIIVGLFTKKGRSKSIELQFGAKVVDDLGVISEEAVFLGKQTVRLFKCEQGGHTFFVLEVKRTAALGFSYAYVKVDDALLNKLNASDK